MERFGIEYRHWHGQSGAALRREPGDALVEQVPFQDVLAWLVGCLHGDVIQVDHMPIGHILG